MAVIQSIPIFNDTKFLSITLPEVLGSSLSFSYILQLYLLLMFLGEFLVVESYSFLGLYHSCAVNCNTCITPLHSSQDSTSTSVISTSRGRDGSAWRRGKPTKMALVNWIVLPSSRTSSTHPFYTVYQRHYRIRIIHCSAEPNSAFTV